MAESTPVKYEDLTDDLKKKHDEIEAVLEVELIGSFEKTRSHDVKLYGNARPWPGVNMVDLSHSIREPEFSFGINMVGLASRHGKDEAESSHSGGKDKEEAGSSDRLRYNDKRYNNEDGIESYNAFNMPFM